MGGTNGDGEGRGTLGGIDLWFLHQEDRGPVGRRGGPESFRGAPVDVSRGGRDTTDETSMVEGGTG